MKHASHSWNNESQPPSLRAHSAEKHGLLKTYLSQYVDTLTKNVRRDRLPLTIVDGFAGGNIYFDPLTKEHRPGSPSIIIDTIHEAEARANERRTKKLKIIDDYFFVENDEKAFESLSQTLKQSPYSKGIGDTIRLINGDFVAYYKAIIQFINNKTRTGQSIFFLDQCGYDKVPFECIRDILNSVPKAEIILTFAADFLIDYLREKRPNRKLSSIPELDLDEFASRVDKGDPSWRKLIQLELHAEVQKFSTARFYTPFFIHSKDSHRDLWLVHLSRHHRARDVMVGVHWDRQNSFAHYGKPGLKMLGYDPHEDTFLTKQPFLDGFHFDSKARTMTKESLFEELPSLIFESPKGLSFEALFSHISNGTSATSGIVRESLRDLSESKHIVIKSADGLTLRRAGVQHHSDMIYIEKQKRLFYWTPLPTLD